MLRYSLLLISLLFVFVSGAEIPKCKNLHDILSLASCFPIVNEMKEYTREHKGDVSDPEVVKNMTVLCGKISKCLSPIHCQEAVEAKMALDKACDMLDYAEDNNMHCLTGFFSTASLSQFSNESSCFKKFDFLERDLTKRQEAYSKGETCFTDYVKAHCNQSSIDYFSKNYKTFADAISIKPSGTECKTAHSQLNAIQCKALADEVVSLTDKLGEVKRQPNDTRMTKALKLCRDTQTCIKDSCLFQASLTDKITDSCDLLKMAQSDIGVCLSGIKYDKPDLSKFECLEDVDFFEKGTHMVCKKLASKRECTKEIMTDICGKESIVGYDIFADQLARLLKCE